jgi:hypothetical protein
MPHYSYTICGLSIESDIPLPELSTDNGSRDPDYRFEAFTPGNAPSCRWLHHYTLSNRKPWLSLAGEGGNYHLRFPELAHFHVSTLAKAIRCYPVPGIPLTTITHLFLDIVIPLVLSQQASLVLHASGVLISGKMIAFLGETGQGKSTITAGLGQRGFPVVTDDCLVVEEKEGQFLGVPLYPSLRLWPEALSALFGNTPKLPRVAHYTDKIRVRMSEDLLCFSVMSGPLYRIYILARHDDVNREPAITIDPLSPRDAFMALVKHPYRLEIGIRERLRKEFDVIGRVVNSIDVHCMSYPRDYALLPNVCETILADLRAEGGGW